MRWIFLVLILIGCTDNTDEEMRLFQSSLSNSGGYVPPTPISADYFIIPLYGQSLSLNTESTPYITPTTVRSYKFDSGLTGTPSGASVLTPITIENDALTNMFKVLENNISTSSFIGCTPGSGGASIAQLSKGTDDYNKLLANITEAKRIADSEGKTIICPSVSWSQGEAQYRDYNDNFTYEANLNTLISDLNTDIKAITGQAEDVYLMMTQIGTHGPYWRYARIAMEMLSAAQNNPLIYLSKSMYVADFVADRVHGQTQDYALMGVKYGYQTANEIIKNNKRKSWIDPVSHSYSSLKSIITFNNIYPPIVFDTTEVQPLPDGNKGFKLFDVYEDPSNTSNCTISEPTAIITNVQIVGNTVEITYDSDPSGSRLTYGINAQEWDKVTGSLSSATTTKSGRTLGARGNLRDSMGNGFSFPITNDAGVQQYDDIYNWCPIFEIQL